MPRTKKFPPFQKTKLEKDGVTRTPLRWTKEQYKTANRLLRERGIKTAWRANKKNSVQAEAALRKKWRERGRYIVSADKSQNNLHFFKQTAKQLRGWKGKVSAGQIFGNGIYLQLPNKVDPKNVRVEPTESGYKIITKTRTTEHITIDPKLLARDPVNAIKKALGKRKTNRKLRYSVFGYEGERPYDLAQFFWYSKNILIPELRSPDRFEGTLTPYQISDAFKIRIVYPTPKHGKKKKKKKK